MTDWNKLRDDLEDETKKTVIAGGSSLIAWTKTHTTIVSYLAAFAIGFVDGKIL
jgi:hypothetical protein